ncbi:MAG: hypothetical protein Q9173_007005 [Seirophora scorigena]
MKAKITMPQFISLGDGAGEIGEKLITKAKRPAAGQEGLVAEAVEADAADGGPVGGDEGGVGDRDDGIEGDVGGEAEGGDEEGDEEGDEDSVEGDA